MKTENLSVDLLRLDAGTQNRVAINEEVVEDYAELIGASNGEWPFPPVDVFNDGVDGNYMVSEGFHRVLSAHRAKRASIPCVIHNGTATDARIFGMTANDRNGLRMTRADKRACVEWLLATGGKMTQTEIAGKAGVSRRFVQIVVSEQNQPTSVQKAHNAPSDGPKASRRANGVTQETSESTDDEEVDYGKCPNCAGTKWEDSEEGVTCAKCLHPHGEPAGGADDDRITTQRQKTIKTLEAAMRAFDDLNLLLPKPAHDEAIASCKALLKTARAWK